ncbi:hypothetical protein KI387_007929, partial [Taxus chinensis]
VSKRLSPRFGSGEMENPGATATAAPAPQYAPHDPSLPEPWRALVDTSTGYIYYWNPQTNVTQYERPIAPPPLPPGPPPAASTPKLAPIPTANPSLQLHHPPSAHPQASVQQATISDPAHANANGLLPVQPKLAPIPIPRNHQGMGEMHLSHAPMGHLNASSASGGLVATDEHA